MTATCAIGTHDYRHMTNTVSQCIQCGTSCPTDIADKYMSGKAAQR